MIRSSGILMPVASLPSNYGIGTLGTEAYRFVDFLKAAKQSYWQMLPVGPTSYGDSPYQSFSTFAGNPYFIDLDMLVEAGMLSESDLTSIDWGTQADQIDYEKLFLNRFTVLKKAYEAFMAEGYTNETYKVEDFRRFSAENAAWLSEYALYMVLKSENLMKSWTQWEDDALRTHQADAIAAARIRYAGDTAIYEFIQYLFYTQWNALRAYARDNGIGIIGDIPIYVALDSADVWSDPKQFQLDEKNCPKKVAGVPPDYFNEEGQLWGNPLYDWDYMKQDGYGWWIRRIDGASKLYDVIRIDHFRGFASYWAVDADSTTAKNGEWVKGPGMDFVGMITNWFWNLQFIAEDLGDLSPDVYELLEASKLPGMKVLEFAFDATGTSNYLPHKFDENCVCYIGTHDNTPVMAWETEEEEENVAFATEYLGLNKEEGFNWGMIRGGMSSVANLFVTQMQDYLGLGAKYRTNTPGVLGGNWQWRMLPGSLDESLAEKIAHMTVMYGRAPIKELKKRQA